MISLQDGGQEWKRGLPVMPFYIVVTFNSVSVLPMRGSAGKIPKTGRWSVEERSMELSPNLWVKDKSRDSWLEWQSLAMLGKDTILKII